uniref:metallophosphoesterase n=1 Tax=Lactiplantibacillus plantarum TaxID=1590 RepID=UPI002240B183
MERRIAIIADVHGNYTAFKAVRDDIVKQQVDECWFMGDLFMPGPGAINIWQLLESLKPTICLRGNWDDDLSQAYRYYQDLILAVSHRDQGELNQLLSQKWATLPWPLRKVQRTLRSHKLEIINSFKYQNYTNGPVEG